jgi:hypothetical protein
MTYLIFNWIEVVLKYLSWEFFFIIKSKKQLPLMHAFHAKSVFGNVVAVNF